jgi:hypothetical protein
MNDLGRDLMRGVVVGTGKRLDEVGQRLATLLTRLFTSRDLPESKARLKEAQRVAHVGYWLWNAASAMSRPNAFPLPVINQTFAIAIPPSA